MKKILIIALLMVGVKGTAQTANSFFETANTFFKTYISNGKVAYDKLHKNPEDLNKVIALAQAVNVTKN
ncbi:DUF547 domain-containing protein, partial [Seonamhaeicola marinus]